MRGLRENEPKFCFALARSLSTFLHGCANFCACTTLKQFSWSPSLEWGASRKIGNKIDKNQRSFWEKYKKNSNMGLDFYPVNFWSFSERPNVFALAIFARVPSTVFGSTRTHRHEQAHVEARIKFKSLVRPASTRAKKNAKNLLVTQRKFCFSKQSSYFAEATDPERFVKINRTFREKKTLKTVSAYDFRIFERWQKKSTCLFSGISISTYKSKFRKLFCFFADEVLSEYVFESCKAFFIFAHVSKLLENRNFTSRWCAKMKKSKKWMYLKNRR